jgi:hypothetical protein
MIVYGSNDVSSRAILRAAFHFRLTFRYLEDIVSQHEF